MEVVADGDRAARALATVNKTQAYCWDHERNWGHAYDGNELVPGESKGLWTAKEVGMTDLWSPLEERRWFGG